MIPYFAYDVFNIGHLTIHVWGLLAGIAIIAALLTALKEAKRKNVNDDNIINIAILIVVGSVVGARFFFVSEFWSYYIKNPIEILYLGDGGMMFYGGAIGAFIASYAYIRYKKIKNFPIILDTIAPSLAIGEFFGRIGCALVNEHVGKITNLPWGQFYPQDGTIRHPISIYMAINGLLIFAILWSIRKKIKMNGTLFLIFLFLYALSRFFLDFARCGDIGICDPHINGFTPSQYISVIILIAVLSLYKYLKTKNIAQTY